MIAKERIEELLKITTDLIETGRRNLKILKEKDYLSTDDFKRKLFEVNKTELRVRQIKEEYERQED